MGFKSFFYRVLHSIFIFLTLIEMALGELKFIYFILEILEFYGFLKDVGYSLVQLENSKSFAFTKTLVGIDVAALRRGPVKGKRPCWLRLGVQTDWHGHNDQRRLET
jgi:hypothetical protein